MKTETYTYIDYGNLEELIEEHLKTEVSGPHNGWNGFSVIADLECSNDSFHVFSNGMLDILMAGGEPEDGWMVTPYYIAKLQDMGVIPKEYPVLLEVSW